MRAENSIKHIKNPNFRQMHLALAFLLFSSAAFAHPGVLIGPSDGNSLRPIYLNEVRDYVLLVTNDSNADLRDFGVEIFTPPQLSLPMAPVPKSSRYFNFPLLVGGVAEQKIFQVKAISFAPGPIELVSRYGKPPFFGSFSTKIVQAGSPLSISMSVSPQGALAGRQGSVLVGVSNSSQQNLSNVRAEVLSVSSSFANEPLEASSLAPGQAAGPKEFKYSMGESSGPIVARVLFEDSSGRHVIEQVVAEPPAQNSPLPLLAVGLVALLVIFSLYWTKSRADSGHSGG